VPLGSEHPPAQALPLIDVAGDDPDPGVGVCLGIKLSKSTGLPQYIMSNNSFFFHVDSSDTYWKNE
jgi:hypothetical protein